MLLFEHFLNVTLEGGEEKTNYSMDNLHRRE